MTYTSLFSLVLDIIRDAPDFQKGDEDLVDSIVCENPHESEMVRPALTRRQGTPLDFASVVIKLRDNARKVRNGKAPKKAMPAK
jgi:hypothetical protein